MLWSDDGGGKKKVRSSGGRSRPIMSRPHRVTKQYHRIASEFNVLNDQYAEFVNLNLFFFAIHILYLFPFMYRSRVTNWMTRTWISGGDTVARNFLGRLCDSSTVPLLSWSFSQIQ